MALYIQTIFHRTQAFCAHMFARYFSVVFSQKNQKARRRKKKIVKKKKKKKVMRNK